MVDVSEVVVRSLDNRRMNAVVADAPEEQGPKPALILLHEIFGINKSMRDTARLFAEEGYLVVVPDLFWRVEEGIELGYGEADIARAMSLFQEFDIPAALEDIAAAIDVARKLPKCNGSVAVLGVCLGGTLAVAAATLDAVEASVAYYPVGLDKLELPRPLHAPVVMHFGGQDPYCGSEAITGFRIRFANDRVRIYEYPGASHAFYNADRAEHNAAAARMSHTRSLELLRRSVGPVYDLEALWEQHSFFEFGLKDADKTIATMVEAPYVNHVPSLSGGVGRKELHHFYKHWFVDVHPDDVEVTLISRTVGVDRVIDEMFSTFTHDRVIEYLLPGIPPTGRKIKLAMIAVVTFRGSRIFHEHIHWDMGSALAQVGLIDPATLPVAGAEAAEKALDRFSHPSNEMLPSWYPPEEL